MKRLRTQLNTWNVRPAITAGRNNYVALLDAAWADHLAPKAPDAPTVVSLFAGCGGSSLGYSMAGYRECLAVEWDAHAAACFRLNFPDVPLYQGDIAQLSAEDALRLSGLQPGELDVLDGSPPCQGFSTAGKRQLDDPRNGLFREYVRLLNAFQPRAFVLENVSGLVKGKMKLVFAEMLRALKVCGYQVSARLMNAMYFQVPQSRERMIILGIRHDLGLRPSHPQAEASAVPFMQLNDASPDDWLTASETQAIQTHAFQQAQRGNSFRFHLIKPALPAPTFSKTLIRKGSAALMLVQEFGQYRLPSHREQMVATSFPLEFNLPGTREQKWARLGNSVPPLFMRAIAQHLRQLLSTPTVVESA